MPKRSVEFFIIDILLALNAVSRKTQSITTANQLLRDEDAWIIVTRQLELVGEAMRNILACDTIKSLAKPAWRMIVDFRNIVAHGYFGINADQVFDIVKKEVPVLEQELLALIKAYPDYVALLQTIQHAKIDLEQIGRVESLNYLQKIEQEINIK